MQRAESPGNNLNFIVRTAQRNARHRAGIYRRVLDGCKRALRGLWVRNERYQPAAHSPDPAAGVPQVRRVPLETATSDAQAQAALRR